MGLESGLVLTAAVVLRHAFRELEGFAFLASVAIALMLVMSALGLAADRSMWWWVYALKYAARHLTAT